MPWGTLLIAGLFEIAWAIGLKYTDGWSKLWPSVITVIFMILSFAFLSKALREIPVGTAYAVWTGIGAVGTAILGIILFSEPLGALRIASMLLVIAGIIGLKLATPASAESPATAIEETERP